MAEAGALGNASQSGESGSEAAASEAAAAAEAESAGGKGESGKPDFLDVKFWNNKTGEADIEGLSKSYTEMGTKIREKTDTTRKTILKELDAEKIANRPKTANDYEVRIPEAIQNEMAEDMSFEFVDNDPMLVFWKDFSHENGFSQEIFDQGVGAYIQAQFAAMPNYGEELEALGDNGRERAQHVNQWALKNLSKSTYEAFESFAVTADGVMAIEEIMRNAGEPAFSPGGAAGTGSAITLNELRAMQADPRYWDPIKRDEAFIKKVDEGYEKLVS